MDRSPSSSQSVFSVKQNRNINAPLPKGYCSWGEYRQKTNDWSIGPGITLINPNFVSKK